MNIKSDLNYMEGYWGGQQMVKHIESTTYKTLDNAITVKQTLIDNFKKEFGYSEEMSEFDRNFSYNYGMLDALKFIKTTQDEK